MITAKQAIEIFTTLQLSHIIWVPDSVIGLWETAIDRSPVQLVRVCREGEAWPLAAGLYAGGARPLILMQTTGLFESGDALRNAVFDLRVPLYAWIGVRNWLTPDSSDSARLFGPEIVKAWHLDHVWIESEDDLPKLLEHYQHCQAHNRTGVALLAEGAG